MKLGYIFNIQQNSLKCTSDTFLITKFYELCSCFSQIHVHVHVHHCLSLFQKAPLDTFRSFVPQFTIMDINQASLDFLVFFLLYPISSILYNKEAPRQWPRNQWGDGLLENLIISLTPTVCHQHFSFSFYGNFPPDFLFWWWVT